MKTAREYSEEWSRDPEITFEEIIEDVQKEAYDEAMRWRDPEMELPKEGRMVQIKVFNHHDNELEYDHDRYLGKNKWGRNTSKYIEIIGWRPIE